MQPDNSIYSLDKIPDDIEDIRYCIFDCSDPAFSDYYFMPLIFLESYYCPAIVLQIGPYTVQMPMDWSILVCDEDYSDMEVVPLTSLNDRGFHTIVFNPLKHMVPETHEINIVNVYSEMKWYFPKVRDGAILVVPVEEKHTPMCMLFVKEKSKMPDVIDIASLFE